MAIWKSMKSRCRDSKVSHFEEEVQRAKMTLQETENLCVKLETSVCV